MGAGPGVIHQALWSYCFALSCIHFSYLGYGASFASFSLENPRLPALPVGTGMPSPSISQESTTSITCLLDCWGRKGLRGGTGAVAKLSFHRSKRASGRQGASQGLWPEKGGSVPALAGKRVRKTLTLAAVFAPHTLPFSSGNVSR